MRSSSMILRKCRTEKPANSAAFGISKNVFLTVVPSVCFMLPPFRRRSMQAECHKGEEARRAFPFWILASGFWLLDSGFWLLFFAHVRISIIRGGDEVLFDGSRANPAEKVHHR